MVKKYDDNDAWIESQFASLSDEGREALEQKWKPTWEDKVNYGVESTRFIPEYLMSYIRSGGNKEILDKENRDRQEALNAKYPHLTEEDRHSGAAITGMVGKSLLDPTYWAAGWLAAPTKLASMAGIPGRLARGGFEAGKWGTVMGGSTALHQAVDEEKIDPTVIAMHSLMGAGLAGPLGMIRGASRLPTAPTPVSAAAEKAEKVAAATGRRKKGRRKKPTTKKEAETPEKIRKSNEILNDLAPKTGTSEWRIIQDVPINSHSLNKANEMKADYLNALKLVNAKDPKAPTASKLKELKKADKIARRFLSQENVLKMFGPQVDQSSEIALKALGEASKQGITDPVSISYLITRPIVGGAAGYGIGHTTKLITGDEDGMSPWFWMAIGMTGGALSNKLRTASLNPATKKTAAESLDALMRNNLKGHISMLTAGTTSAANNVLGGWAAKLNRAFSYQFGPGLKGPAVPGLEQRNAAILDELTAALLGVGGKWGISGAGDAAVAIRRAVWSHGERMVAGTKSGRHTLKSIEKDAELQAIIAKNASEGMTAKSLLATIRGASDDYIRLETQFGAEMFNVAPWAKPLKGRVFSQKWDIAKIRKNPEEAEKALAEAYKIQRMEELIANGEKVTRGKLLAQEIKARKHIQNIMTHGKVSDPIIPKGGRVAKAGKDMNKSMWNKNGKINPRPLINNLERDRNLEVFEARKAFKDFLEQDVQTLFNSEIEATIPTLEFVRTFGPNGEVINAVKGKIRSQFKALRNEAQQQGRVGDLPKLAKIEQTHHKAIENMVDLYFKRYHIDSPLAGSNMAHNIAGIVTTMANTVSLPKVSVSSLGDLILPFQNSGGFNAIRGNINNLSKRKYNELLDFAAKDPAIAEFSALTARTANPGSLTQRATQKINEAFFRAVGLGKLTRFSRRQAFNIGVRNTFDVAKKMLQTPSRSIIRRANALGLTDDYIYTLKKFNTIDDAMKNEKARRILAIGGRMDADFNSLIPNIFNRRAFTQSNNPLVRSLGQFLSWAQAKTSQTNALVTRIEDKDIALAVRMIGTLVIYDGILTFKDMLNDPTGTRLKEDGYGSWAEKFVSPQQAGRTMQFSANFGTWWADRFSSVMSPYTSRDSLGNVSPGLSWLTEATRVLSPVPYRGLTGSFWRNIGQKDWAGATKQLSYITPFGKEIVDVSSLIGYDLTDKTPEQLENERTRGSFGLAKGGIVENVSQVPKEPDERIDKMTGLPYNVQAGKAFIDEEDPEKRLELNKGGIAYDDSLERLGFSAGSLVKAFSTLARGVSRKGRSNFVKVEKPLIQSEEGYAAEVLNRAKREVDIQTESGDVGEIFISGNVQSSPIKDKIPTADQIKLWKDERIKALEKMGWKEGGVPIPGRIREEILVLGEKADDFTAGKISNKQYKEALENYDKLVLEEFAPTVFEHVPIPAEALDILSSVRFKKSLPIKERQVIGVNHGIEGGELVALRLDIPAYNSYDTWVVTVHNAKNAKDISGKVRAYASTGHIKDVHFGSDPLVALRIAKGEKSKSTIARMVGKWQKHDSEDLYRRAIDLLPKANDPKNKEWVQVGMNPYRHSWFYEKTTLRPVKSAEEVIQIGGLVLARNPVYSHILHKDYLVRTLGQASKGQAPEVLQHYEKGGIVGEELERLGYVEGGVATESLELIDLETLPKRKPIPITLRNALRKDVTVASRRQNRQMFGLPRQARKDNRWGEFEDNVAYINHAKFRKTNEEGYEDPMILGETLHNLRNVAPTIHTNIYETAMNDPVARTWMESSWNEVTKKPTDPETRDFETWVRDSRLDQIIGAHILAKPDSPIPTMRNWHEQMGYAEDKPLEGYAGPEFVQVLDDLIERLDQPFNVEAEAEEHARMFVPPAPPAEEVLLPTIKIPDRDITTEKAPTEKADLGNLYRDRPYSLERRKRDDRIMDRNYQDAPRSIPEGWEREPGMLASTSTVDYPDVPLFGEEASLWSKAKMTIDVPINVRAFSDLLKIWNKPEEYTEADLSDLELATLQDIAREQLLAGRKIIEYSDYRSAVDPMQDVDWTKMGSPNVTDVRFNLKTFVGGTTLLLDENRNVLINDDFGFSDAGANPADVAKALAGSVTGRGYGALRKIASTVGKREGPPIRINLGNINNLLGDNMSSREIDQVVQDYKDDKLNAKFE